MDVTVVDTLKLTVHALHKKYVCVSRQLKACEHQNGALRLRGGISSLSDKILSVVLEYAVAPDSTEDDGPSASDASKAAVNPHLRKISVNDARYDQYSRQVQPANASAFIVRFLACPALTALLLILDGGGQCCFAFALLKPGFSLAVQSPRLWSFSFRLYRGYEGDYQLSRPPPDFVLAPHDVAQVGRRRASPSRTDKKQMMMIIISQVQSQPLMRRSLFFPLWSTSISQPRYADASLVINLIQCSSARPRMQDIFFGP